MKKRVSKAFNKPENFLKHADKDHDSVLDFPTENTEGYILDAIETYEALTKEAVPLFSTFKLWMYIHTPQVFKADRLAAFNEAIKTIGVDVSQFTRAELFKHVLPHFTSLGAS